MSIKERCYDLIPSLANAEVLSEKTGLRPHRDPVRVEKQFIRTPAKTLKIVHNYGHGGYGVTTAPGTAMYAVKLSKEMHNSRSKL